MFYTCMLKTKLVIVYYYTIIVLVPCLSCLEVQSIYVHLRSTHVLVIWHTAWVTQAVESSPVVMWHNKANIDPVMTLSNMRSWSIWKFDDLSRWSNPKWKTVEQLVCYAITVPYNNITTYVLCFFFFQLQDCSIWQSWLRNIHQHLLVLSSTWYM